MARNLPETAPENNARMGKLFPAAAEHGVQTITSFIPLRIGYRLEGGIIHFTPDVPGQNNTPFGEQIEGRFDNSPGDRGTKDNGWDLEQTTSPLDADVDHVIDLSRGNSRAGGTEHTKDPDDDTREGLLGLLSPAVQ